jgi:hypothetical protein
MRKTLMLGLVVLVVGGALAQSTDLLPSKLSGRWTATTIRGVFIDTLSLTFEGNGQSGSVTGRITMRGRSCGAQDEPFQGSWDGAALRIDTVHRPNVNTQIMNGTCGSGRVTYMLQRKPGEKAFDGELLLDGAQIGVTVSVSP